MKKLKLIPVFIIFCFALHAPGSMDLYAQNSVLEKAEDAMTSATEKIENSMEKVIGKVDSLEGKAAEKIEELTQEPEKRINSEAANSAEQSAMGTNEKSNEQTQTETAMPEQVTE